nr:thiamine transporter 1-like isoform X2 [Ciona intestinalis]|eukprot:XP_002131058.1 thiamine transporter 1-like isoform X2 [Ciona intestinalis]
MESAASDRSWLKPTVLLCVYGIFSYMKPSEPFLTPYLMGLSKNFTEFEVVNEIYPVWTYAYVCFLLPVFLLTDYVKYKPVILMQGLGYIGCWILLLFAQEVPLMQVMQVSYAIATAGEIGYYSYIYSIVKQEHYQRVTSYVRSTTLIGLFLGSLIGQLLVLFADVTYFDLNIFSLVNVSIAFVISWFLPMPKKTLFFFTEEEDMSGSIESTYLNEENPAEKASEVNADGITIEERGPTFLAPKPNPKNESKIDWKGVLVRLWADVKSCYMNTVLLRWSVWWALSTCGWLLVVNYAQNLWETIYSSAEGEVYNGAVEAAATVLGALGAFCVGFIKLNWTRWGEIALGLCSLCKCGLLLLMYWTTDIWLCYAAFVGFIVLYNFVITITQFQLAVGLNTQRFALVFGVNTFTAVLLNTVLTVILIDKAGFGLDVNTQFIIYSGYFAIIAVIFLLHGVYFLCKNSFSSSSSFKSTSIIIDVQSVYG